MGGLPRHESGFGSAGQFQVAWLNSMLADTAYANGKADEMRSMDADALVASAPQLGGNR